MKRFYNTKVWKAKRKKILERDEYKCQECKRYGKRIEAKEVHHIKPLEDFPDEALSDENLISLCEKCHKKKHPEKGTKAAKTRIGMPPLY